MTRRQAARATSLSTQTPEGQATLDALADLGAALTNLDTIITATGAGGSAWDAATPAQRTATIRLLARACRALALLLRGTPIPLGNARVPD